MEDKNNNLGDFLRKKFDDFEGPTSNWEKPDEAIKDSILSNLSTGAPAKMNYRKFVLRSAACALFLLGLGCIWYLNQQNNTLQDLVENQKESITLSNTELTSLTQKHQKEKASLLSENEQLKKNKEAVESQKADLETQIQKQEIKIQQVQQQRTDKEVSIAQLKGENQQLEQKLKEVLLSPQESLNQAAISDQLIPEEKKKEYNKLSISNLSLPLFATALKYRSTINSNPLIKPVKKHRKKFEIGYALGMQEFKAPVNVTFENQRIASDNSKAKELYVFTNGLNLGYSPAQNWWIKGGLNFASFSVAHDVRVSVAYDKTREIIRPDGMRGNSLQLSSINPYGETKSTVNIIIPQDTELDQDDLLEVRLQERQSYRYFQVPLGVEYIYGERALKWHMRGGVEWNKIVFGANEALVTLESRRQVIPTEHRGESIRGRRPESKQFFSSYVGLGLNYRLFNQLHANAGFTYHFNFINNKTNRFSNTTKRSTAFNMGLCYQF